MSYTNFKVEYDYLRKKNTHGMTYILIEKKKYLINPVEVWNYKKAKSYKSLIWSTNKLILQKLKF